MAFADGSFILAPAGTTGNQTLPAGNGFKAGDSYETAMLQFVVETASGGPSITFKFQGSLDGTNWYDIIYVTDSSDVPAVAAITRTTTGSNVLYSLRPYQYFRVVTTGAAGTIVYRAEWWMISD